MDPNPLDPYKIPLSDFQLLLWLSKTFEPKAHKLNLTTRKRFQGDIDVAKLTKALSHLIQQHPILNGYISTLYPSQTFMPQTKQIPPIETIALQAENNKYDVESILNQSIHALTAFQNWSKNKPLMLLKVFYLPKQQFEIQLCVPHLIADETSLDILWQELSKLYFKGEKASGTPNHSFLHFIRAEQHLFTTQFEDNYIFWKQHLAKVALPTLPSEHIIRKTKGFQYSTYQPLSKHLIYQLKQAAANYHVTVEQLICAAIAKSLSLADRKHQDNFLINLVKSTRTHQDYDQAIGCFLRIDPIKIQHGPQDSLKTIAENIQKTMLETADHAHASSILKLACMAEPYANPFQQMLFQVFITLYAKILQTFQFNYHALKLISYLSAFEHNNQFLVYVNIWNNFIQPQATHGTLFGLPTQSIPLLKTDLSQFDNILDFSFIRDESENTPYLVISSNLSISFRERLAQDIMTCLIEEAILEIANATAI